MQEFFAEHKERIMWVTGLLFILLNSILIVNELYFLPLLPLALIVLYLFFFKLDWFLLIIVVCTPLSILLEDDGFNVSMALPTEPLLFGVLLLVILKFITQGYDKRYLKHPLTVCILIYLAWMLFTAITSELHLVSFKFFVSKLWFVLPFYFLGIYLFQNPKNIVRFQWLYILPLTAVIIYTLIRHTQWGMNNNAAHWVMEPFFRDHTSYGAAIAMFFFSVYGFLFFKKINPAVKILMWILALIFTAGLVFSYTRAAWVSVFLALLLLFTILLKIKFRTVVLLIAMFVIALIPFKDDFLMSLEKNRQDSSAKLSEHVKSISNISTDASNLERLNRWSCAIRMYQERPILGWGPGTYQHLYAPYQVASQKTIISTNSGDLGNAHSEYIGPLAESGIPGLLLIVALFSMSVFYGIRAYKKMPDKEIRIIVLTSLLGIFTYITHGIMNNFLDIDKAAVPFWAILAMFVSIDIHYKLPTKKEPNKPNLPVTEEGLE